MADPWITEQDVVDHLGRGDASDPGISQAISVACGMVRNFTEQDWLEDTRTILVDGTGTDALLLPQAPVTNIGQVQVAGEAVTDYVLRDDGVLIRTLDSEEPTVSVAKWPEGRQNVEVRYTAGYPSSAEMPDEVAGIAVMLAGRMVLQGPVLEERVGQTTVKYAGAAADLTTGEKMMLRKYRVAR